MTNVEELLLSLPKGSYQLNEPMAKHTTVRIGGPADIWYEARSTEDLIQAIKLARKHMVSMTILGWGSNVLIGDKGIRGLVIHNITGEVEIDTSPLKGEENNNKISPRWEADKTKGTFKYDFTDLNYDESDYPRIEAAADSGVGLPYLINYLIDRGVTGLQWFSGIPGTVGGAVFNNIHGGTRFFHEFLKDVTVLTEDGEIETLAKEELGLDYDKSRFHQSGEIVLGATLQLFKGDKMRAKKTAEEWARRKMIQPKNSPGCVFKNITEKEKAKLGYPTTGVGYIVEHVLKMGGFRIGDAVVSTAHHNFIVNAEKARAVDYLCVMKEIQRRAKEEIGIELEPEIFFVGDW